MKVKQLIKELKKMPQNAKVYHIWDGEPRTEINHVYFSKSGKVMTLDDINEKVYTDKHKPFNQENINVL